MPTDAGDFGRGIYYSSSYHRALTYGLVEKSTIKFANPLVLTSSEAYKLADKFHTVRIPEEDIKVIAEKHPLGERSAAIQKQLLLNAQAMTDDVLSKGYDGLIAVGKDLEIVDYRPYSA
jgi:hypothetical protein